MKTTKLAATAIVAMASILCATGRAQQAAPVPDEKAAPASRSEKAAPAAQPDATRTQPGTAPPARMPTRRRSVQQIISTMPQSPPVATDAYRPTLQPRAPSPAIPSSGFPAAGGVVQPNPPPPVQVICSAGGCTDTNGTRYNGGIGNTAITPQGRACTRIGTTMQCF
jgi:hypothetical protein